MSKILLIQQLYGLQLLSWQRNPSCKCKALPFSFAIFGSKRIILFCYSWKSVAFCIVLIVVSVYFVFAIEISKEEERECIKRWHVEAFLQLSCVALLKPYTQCTLIVPLRSVEFGGVRGIPFKTQFCLILVRVEKTINPGKAQWKTVDSIWKIIYKLKCIIHEPAILMRRRRLILVDEWRETEGPWREMGYLHFKSLEFKVQSKTQPPSSWQLILKGFKARSDLERSGTQHHGGALCGKARKKNKVSRP